MTFCLSLFQNELRSHPPSFVAPRSFPFFCSGLWRTCDTNVALKSATKPSVFAGTSLAHYSLTISGRNSLSRCDATRNRDGISMKVLNNAGKQETGRWKNNRGRIYSNLFEGENEPCIAFVECEVLWHLSPFTLPPLTFSIRSTAPPGDATTS